MAFLAFEGIDGCGKSTLIQGLRGFLEKSGISVHLTREPGGTPMAEEIRQMLIRVDDEVPSPRTELLLYEAGRAQHVDLVIRPCLEKGQWVLSDRFAASSLAFQAGGRGLDEPCIQWLNSYAVNGCWPDLNILLDLPVEEGLRRREKREAGGQAADRFELEKLNFHQAVREHYLKQVTNDPKDWLVLDARQTPEDLLNNLIEQLRGRNCLD